MWDNKIKKKNIYLLFLLFQIAFLLSDFFSWNVIILIIII